MAETLLSAVVREDRRGSDQPLCYIPAVDQVDYKSPITPTPREKAGLFILHDRETAAAE